ncbi:MAG: EF-hand domain-containing protein [Gammaproteobacteria bacterium]
MKTLNTLITTAAFCAALFAQTASANPSVELFKKLDKDGNGVLTPKEAEANTDIAENFEDGDDNNDGKLDMAEFQAMDVTDE